MFSFLSLSGSISAKLSGDPNGGKNGSFLRKTQVLTSEEPVAESDNFVRRVAAEVSRVLASGFKCRRTRGCGKW